MGGKVTTFFGAWYHATKYELESFSDALRIVTTAIQVGVVTKLGEWYSFNGPTLGRGTFGVKEYLSTHPTVFEALSSITREALQFN